MKFHFTSYPLFLLSTIFASHMSDALYIDGMVRLFRGEGNYNDDINSQHATLTGSGASFQTDTLPTGAQARQVMYFNGNGKAYGPATGLPGGDAHRTIIGWFKRADAGFQGQGPFGYGHAGVCNLSYYAHMDWPRFALDQTCVDEGVNPVMDTVAVDTWYHVAFSYDGTYNRAYVNGVLVGTGEPTPRTGEPADYNKPNTLVSSDIQVARATFGGDPHNPITNTQGFKGYVADFAIFNRAITDAEVASIYNAPLGLTATSSLGEFCTSDSNCGSGICVSNVCTDGAIGSACASGSDCSTGYCSPTSSTCATDPYLDPCYRITCSNHGKCKGNGICHCENTFIQTNDGKDCACPDGSFLDASANRCYAPTASPTSSPTSLPVTSSPTLLITSAPTGSPSFENPPVCENDSSYKFKLKRVQKEVDCLWISKNKKRKEKRRAKYCTEDFDNGALVAACKKSCDLCTV